MEEQDSDDSKVQFNISISTDRDHFLRRSCPSCGRDFKTEIDPADLAWALSSQIQRMGLEIGATPVSEDGATQYHLLCPYCQHSAEASEMHTEETLDYLKRFAYHEYVLPLINNLFSGLEDSVGSGGGGFLSISVRFEHSRMVAPPRPIHGPEPSDMKIIELLCCGRKIKVSDGWDGVRVCTYCGIEVALI